MWKGVFPRQLISLWATYTCQHPIHIQGFILGLRLGYHNEIMTLVLCVNHQVFPYILRFLNTFLSTPFRVQIPFSALGRAPILFTLAKTICHTDRFNGHTSILGTSNGLLSLDSHHANCHHGHGEKRQDLRSWLHPSQFQQTFVVQCVVQCKKYLKYLVWGATSASHFLLYSQSGTSKCAAGSGGPEHLLQPLSCPNS